jgi:desulfoferrodoxin (superoxide reductase-like protein)
MNGGAVTVCILMTALLLALLPAPGGAHPPKEVALSYDQAKQTLEVRITHGVSDPAKHYIETVEIRKAGKTIAKTEYKSQPEPTTFVYSYPLDAAPGDVIEVKAACSVFGSKTEKLTVEK